MFFSNSVGISICKARVHGSLPECGTMVDADGFENAEKCRGSTGLFEAIAGQLGPGLGAQDSKKTWGTDSVQKEKPSNKDP